MKDICKVTILEAIRIIRTREPIGLFIIYQKDGYIGLDNSKGYAWTEAFKTKEECEIWLRRED